MNYMRQREIIKNWKKLGMGNLQEYHTMKGDRLKEKWESIEQFSRKIQPEKTNPKTFWKATDKVFSTDTVCNTLYTGQTNAFDITKTNITNHQIPVQSGQLGHIINAMTNIMQFGMIPSIAEIGTGYGSFYENFIVPSNLQLRYTGFDLIKRVPYVEELKGKRGNFGKDQLKKYNRKFNLIYSCNVFQHLSKQQIKQYIKDFTKLLIPGGWLSLMYVTNHKISFHYGQIIELFTEQELIELLQEHDFELLMINKETPNVKGGLNKLCLYLQYKPKN